MRHWSVGGVIALGVLLLSAAQPVAAQTIANRGDLNALLGGSAATENFEAVAINPGSGQTFTAAPQLDATSTVFGQGPGLIIPGVAFKSYGPSGTDFFQWNGNGYFGMPTKTLLSTTKNLEINFATPATAFGVDLLTFDISPDTATVKVYDASDNEITSQTRGISGGTSTAFFGFQNASGIKRVVISGTLTGSPVIDNVTFGTVEAASAVPEPSSALLFLPALGVVALIKRRRSS